MTFCEFAPVSIGGNETKKMKSLDETDLIGTSICAAPFAEQHLKNPRYLKWLNDLEVMRLIGREEYLEPVTFEVARQYVEAVWASTYCHFFAICTKKDATFIGTAKINYLNDVGLKTQTADIGIMIGDRTVWGKGIATDTLFTVSRFAFDKLAARKLTAGAVAENGAVIRAFTKIGYLEEARLRRKVPVQGGYMDHVLLGCFPDELIAPAPLERFVT